jgi:hypothetical protein
MSPTRRLLTGGVGGVLYRFRVSRGGGALSAWQATDFAGFTL